MLFSILQSSSLKLYNSHRRYAPAKPRIKATFKKIIQKIKKVETFYTIEKKKYVDVPYAQAIARLQPPIRISLNLLFQRF